ncbi:MAG: hypothetical protein DRJ43_04135 [Thermoprotei archaeon]|nr:MAG: hypothetical protein DRJ43_04135 [Thermoprotei archaeon]
MKWCRVKAFFISGLKTTFRDRASIFWVFIWPIILVFMTAYVFIPPSVGQPLTLDMGVVNYDHSEAPFNGTAFIEVLKIIEYNGTKLFNVRVYEDEDLLLGDLTKGELDVGIVIPSGFGNNLTFSQAKLKVYVSGGNVYSIQVNRAMVSEFLRRFSIEAGLRKVEMSLRYMNMSYVPSKIPTQGPWGDIGFLKFIRNYMLGLVEPINVTIVEKVPEALATRPAIIGWYIIGALGMMMLYTGFVIGSTAIVEEKERGSLDRILSTPVKESEMLAGRSLAGLIVLLLSSLAIVITGVYAIGAKIDWNPLSVTDWLVPLNLIMIGLMTIGIGYMLSLLARTSRGASSMGTTLGLILSFTAGVWFPKEWMPAPMRVLADMFPITWALDTIRDIVVFNIGLGEALTGTVRNVIATAAIFAVGVIAYKKTLRKYAEL